jgi:hypothetical protein
VPYLVGDHDVMDRINPLHTCPASTTEYNRGLLGHEPMTAFCKTVLIQNEPVNTFSHDPPECMLVKERRLWVREGSRP